VGLGLRASENGSERQKRISRAYIPAVGSPPTAGAGLSRRVGKVVGYPPLIDLSAEQRREFHEALLEADTFEDLPGKWQAAVLKAEQNQPKLRAVNRD
jgi:hypothetical protein